MEKQNWRIKNLPDSQKLSDNGNWKGGEITRSDGYILVRIGYITRNKKGARYKLKHRIVMEEFLKRPLLRSEVIHHKNGIKNDNRIENLEVTSQSKHAKEHFIEFYKNKRKSSYTH